MKLCMKVGSQMLVWVNSKNMEITVPIMRIVGPRDAARGDAVCRDTRAFMGRRVLRIIVILGMNA